jgi:hypothetical protein
MTILINVLFLKLLSINDVVLNYDQIVGETVESRKLNIFKIVIETNHQFQSTKDGLGDSNYLFFPKLIMSKFAIFIYGIVIIE